MPAWPRFYVVTPRKKPSFSTSLTDTFRSNRPGMLIGENLCPSRFVERSRLVSEAAIESRRQKETARKPTGTALSVRRHPLFHGSSGLSNVVNPQPRQHLDCEPPLH